MAKKVPKASSFKHTEIGLGYALTRDAISKNLYETKFEVPVMSPAVAGPVGCGKDLITIVDVNGKLWVVNPTKGTAQPIMRGKT